MKNSRRIYEKCPENFRVEKPFNCRVYEDVPCMTKWTQTHEVQPQKHANYGNFKRSNFGIDDARYY
jgi:hypothetical protein